MDTVGEGMLFEDGDINSDDVSDDCGAGKLKALCIWQKTKTPKLQTICEYLILCDLINEDLSKAKMIACKKTTISDIGHK